MTQFLQRPKAFSPNHARFGRVPCFASMTAHAPLRCLARLPWRPAWPAVSFCVFPPSSRPPVDRRRSVAIAFAMAAKGLLFIVKLLSLVTLMAASVIWGSQAEQQALHPPLRQLLDERLGGFAIAAIDTERHDTPLVIEGRLTSDAHLTDNGATLRLTVDRVWLSACPEFTRGGVSLTIVGALAAQSVAEWRAGQVVRVPAALRRPTRYLDHGVPDQERLLARRGVALVGTVKSAALVQVRGRGCGSTRPPAHFVPASDLQSRDGLARTIPNPPRSLWRS